MPKQEEIKLEASDFIYDLVVLGYLKQMRESATAAVMQSVTNLQELGELVDEDAGETAESVVKKQTGQ